MHRLCGQLWATTMIVEVGTTIEPLNNGHFGARVAFRYLEVVRYLEVESYIHNSTLIHYQIVLIITFHQ